MSVRKRTNVSSETVNRDNQNTFTQTQEINETVKSDNKKDEKISSSNILRSSIGVILIIAMSQLFAFLGEGAKDPFIGKGTKLTILQTTAAIAILVQIIVFLPSYIYQTEKFYDLTGSLTYVTCIVYTLLAGAKANQNKYESRSIIATVMVLVWCIRLGYFLFKRVLSVGKDSRFDRIKPSFTGFLVAWVLQGLWVFLTAFCAFIINADQASKLSKGTLVVSDIVGITIWSFGFLIEFVADYQKSSWRNSKNKPNEFIDVGLWYYSRHPNYFGEMTLWAGMFVLSVSVLSGRQYAAIISPLFVFLLINFVSGVPLLEKSSDKKFGHLKEYQEYKRSTSSLILAPKGWLGDKSFVGTELNTKAVSE